MNWLIPANPNKYDVDEAFLVCDYIDWRQSNNQEIGDTVYIYCSGDIRSLRFKCDVIEVNKSYEEINDDGKFWLDRDEYEKSKKERYMRLVLQEVIDTDKLSYEKLKEYGLNSKLQGAIKLDNNPTLLKYIEKYFGNNQEDIQPDEIDGFTDVFEGAKTKVIVNKFERNKVARANCIREFGCSCTICEFNFEEVYGDLGKGFIHVHHLVPLSQIGEEYKVDYKKDLIPVCPNCHAMLHRKLPSGDYLSIEDLRRIVKNT